jgi:hypothetical protein
LRDRALQCEASLREWLQRRAHSVAQRGQAARTQASARLAQARQTPIEQRSVIITVNGIEQVDHAVARHWHANWLRFLEAKRLEVEARRQGHTVDGEEGV